MRLVQVPLGQLVCHNQGGGMQELDPLSWQKEGQAPQCCTHREEAAHLRGLEVAAVGLCAAVSLQAAAAAAAVAAVMPGIMGWPLVLMQHQCNI